MGMMLFVLLIVFALVGIDFMYNFIRYGKFETKGYRYYM